MSITQKKLGIATVLLAVIAAIDIAAPPGFALWLEYLLPVFLIRRYPQKTVYRFAVAMTAFMVAGFLLPWTGQLWLPLLVLNRTAGIISVWVAVILLTRSAAAGRERERLLAEFEATVRALPNGFVMYNTDGTIRFINTTAREILGYSEEYLHLPPEQRLSGIGASDADGTPLSRNQYPFFRALRGETVRGQVIKTTARDRTTWLSLSAAPIRTDRGEIFGAVAGFSDITRLILLQQSVAESEQQFRGLFEHHRAAMLLIDPDSGKIEDANDAAAAYYGYTREQLRTMNINQINQLAPDQIAREMQATLEEKRPYHVFPHRCASGTVCWVEVYSSPIQVKDRQILFSIIHDITERRQAEEALRQRTEELATANRELESFSYSVSHDLRAPLNTLSAFSEILLEDYRDRLDQDGRDYLGRIIGGVQKMNELIEDMLSLSRISRQEMDVEEIDLSEMADSIIAELRESSPERRVEVAVQEDLKARGDKRLLRIALTNLLNNAWKYTGKTENPRIEFGSGIRDGERVFCVRDNGAGFPAKQADRLFQPFQRLHTESQFSGTGIGLPIVLRVIRRHRGRVWAEGEVGAGATFYFTLG
jgi:hypothetical protein